MLHTAGKYTPVPAARDRAAGPTTVSTATMIKRAVRLRNVKRTAALRQKFPHVFIPSFAPQIGWKDWATREMRSGGLIEGLLDRERRTSAARFRSVAKARKDYQHNPKADIRLVASIPVNEFHRARQVDKDFWADNQNLRNYKRDNPDAFIKL